MSETFIFTDIERQETVRIFKQLKDSLGDTLLPDDEKKIIENFRNTFENGQLRRNVFGLNPVLAPAS